MSNTGGNGPFTEGNNDNGFWGANYIDRVFFVNCVMFYKRLLDDTESFNQIDKRLENIEQSLAYLIKEMEENKDEN